MKSLLIAIACIVLSAPCLAQGADEPATRDDVILYLRTMRSQDTLKRMMETQLNTMQQLLRDQVAKEKGGVPSDFDAHFKASMDDLIKGMPLDQIQDAMIPAYQAHFTRGDIEAMNAFYSSPVGQKVLHELPAVTEDGMKAALPIMSKYFGDWIKHMKHDLNTAPADSTVKTGDAAPAQN